MTWNNAVPAPPDSISTLSDDALKRRAQAAWMNCHTLLNAIDAWQQWLSIVGSSYQLNPDGTLAEGDEIIRAGQTAIETLCGLHVNCDAFRFDPDAEQDGATPLSHWPMSPLETIDATWYVYRGSAEESEIRTQRTMMEIVLKPDVQRLV